MSATNRGAIRMPDDWYETPAWCTRAILRKLGDVEPSRILEPMAGRGAIVRELRAHWPNTHIDAVELDPKRGSFLNEAGVDGVHVGCDYLRDFRPSHRTRSYDLIISNPSFALAMQTIDRSLSMCRKLVLLLRLNFLGSQERAPFLRRFPPDVDVLSRRPSFAASLKCRNRSAKCKWVATLPLDVPRPKRCPRCQSPGVTVTLTDSSEYAWMSWTPRGGNRWGILDIEADG